MKTQINKSYQSRLKKMKESIDENKNILDSDFPDDVTVSGSPDLLDKKDDEIDQDHVNNNIKEDGSCQKKEK